LTDKGRAFLWAERAAEALVPQIYVYVGPFDYPCQSNVEPAD